MRRARFVVRAVGGSTMRGNRRGPWFVLDTRNPDGYPPLTPDRAAIVASFDTQLAALTHARELNNLDRRKPTR